MRNALAIVLTAGLFLFGGLAASRSAGALPVAPTDPMIPAAPPVPAAPPAPAAPPVLAAPAAPLTSTLPAYLPLALRASPASPLAYPSSALVRAAWRAAERFGDAYIGAPIFPAYAAEAGGPSAANALANVDAACHDFPDRPDFVDAGMHRAACYEWVASYLALFHAARGWQAGSAIPAESLAQSDPTPDPAADLAWAGHYLRLELDRLEPFVFGPEDLPPGTESHRDNFGAVWQNPLRAASLALVVDLLGKQGSLEPADRERAADLLSGIARAWYAAFRVAEPGSHPTTGVPLVLASHPAVSAFSLSGKQVASRAGWTFRWNADKGNTPAEEVSWTGAGVALATRLLEGRLEDGEVLREAARHWLDYALVFDRPDPIHGGRIRTLNAETEGGAYGQRRYWLENHTDDVPSLPYLGFTWQAIGMGLFTVPGQAPWPGLAADEAQWQVLLHSAGESLRAPDGSFLVDMRPGGGLGYAMDALPLWRMPCGQWIAGRHYVHYDGRAGGDPLYVSEIGHPAGLDLLAMGWPILRLAAERGDAAAYGTWQARLERVFEEYGAQPPSPHWAQCNIAPYVSNNPGYHAARLSTILVIGWLGLSGYTVDPWPSLD